MLYLEKRGGIGPSNSHGSTVSSQKNLSCTENGLNKRTVLILSR